MLQYDFEAGLDPTALAQITSVQLLQMINQLYPVANIGGVIYQSTTPDVANNPRFARYAWLDSTTDAPVLKVYNDVLLTWGALPVADASITAAKLANYAVSVLNGSGAPKIAYKQDGTADATVASFVLGLDAAGQYVEVSNLTLRIQATSISTDKLTSGAVSDGMILQWSAAQGKYVPVSLSVSGLISANSVTPDRLTNSTPGYILKAAAGTGVWTAVSTDDKTNNIFANGSIPVGRLYSAVGAAGVGVLALIPLVRISRFLNT